MLKFIPRIPSRHADYTSFKSVTRGMLTFPIDIKFSTFLLTDLPANFIGICRVFCRSFLEMVLVNRAMGMDDLVWLPFEVWG